MEEPSAEEDDSWAVLVKAKEKVRLRKKGDWFRVTRRGFCSNIRTHQNLWLLKVLVCLETKKNSLKEETIVWKP